ncbi:hypothetical protein L1887_02819 [Cichorium endivia]|nr:hypothetical protein L1887_02819 [Cichorium endivia]
MASSASVQLFMSKVPKQKIQEEIRQYRNKLAWAENTMKLIVKEIDEGRVTSDYNLFTIFIVITRVI